MHDFEEKIIFKKHEFEKKIAYKKSRFVSFYTVK